ncbi:hypothetical protein Tco_0242258 [Tanacetum coccineum]
MLCTVFSAIKELVDIVKKTLEFGARGVESCSIVEDEELCYAVTRIPRNSSRDDGRFVRQHEAIRIPFQRVEMMVMVKVKENVLDVVIQITSLVNVQSRQRTTIKEHLLEEHGAIMEKMK